MFDGFNYRQFNSNAVVRYEYRPGSTLFAVWQQGRNNCHARRPELQPNYTSAGTTALRFATTRTTRSSSSGRTG